MSRVIVTGANSFVGRALVKELVSEGNDVFAIIGESTDASALGFLDQTSRIYRCDMSHYSNLPAILPDLDYESCFHLAWAGSAGKARSDWRLQLTDAACACDLVAALAEMGVSRYIGVGTLAELDVLSYTPEDGSTPNAVSVYGVAKLAAHFATKAICADLDLDHIWCRLVNVYGPGNATGNFADMASRRFLRGERASFTQGTQAYDFIYIDDAARALVAVAKNGRSGCTYLIGSGQSRPLRDYICMIRDAADPSAEVYLGEVPFNGNALGSDAYDVSKLGEHTGFVPQVSFEEGIAKTIQWLKETM